MSQEQKAKAYDEAIRKIKGMMPNWELLSYNGKTFLQDLINIFPELTESEDEKIRKELIEHIKANSSSDFVLFQKFSPNDVLVWLEKQGTSYTKRDIDDAYIKGMSDAKRELKKQGEKKCIDDLTQQEAMDIAVAKCFEQGGQKPTWSEEDEKWMKYLNEMLDYNFQNFTKFEPNAVDAYNWLKTIKQRIGG